MKTTSAILLCILLTLSVSSQSKKKKQDILNALKATNEWQMVKALLKEELEDDITKLEDIYTGENKGELLYWDGNSWLLIPPGKKHQILTFDGEKPVWQLHAANGEIISPGTGRIWLDKNLGASQVAVSVNDSLAYGDLYQWGRKTDGHEKRDSFESKADSIVKHTFILTDNPDWRKKNETDLWHGLNGENNPCPSGFRLPTSSEFNAEISQLTTKDADGAFKALKLTKAGYRNHTNGIIMDDGFKGYYWTRNNSPYGEDMACAASFDETVTTRCNSNKAYGYSVRCIKE